MINLCKYSHPCGRYTDGKCKTCVNERSKKYRDKNPEAWLERVRNSVWKRVYKILNKDGSQFTSINYDRAYQVQQGACGICKKHQSVLDRRLAADHDHKTGIFRGLLCASCNKNLGIKENIEWNIKAQEYLNGY